MLADAQSLHADSIKKGHLRHLGQMLLEDNVVDKLVALRRHIYCTCRDSTAHSIQSPWQVDSFLNAEDLFSYVALVMIFSALDQYERRERKKSTKHSSGTKPEIVH